MTDAVLLLILSVTTAIAAPFLSRHPLVMAWLKRRSEQRILAAPLPSRLPPRPSPLPAVFREGPMPSHEDCAVLPGEEISFSLIAGELGYAWVADVLRASREADQ